MDQKTQDQPLQVPLRPLPTVFKKITQKWENYPLQAKLASARQNLEQLYQKFSSLADPSIFKELDRFAAILEDEFIRHRSISHLTKLAYSIALIRRKLSQEIALLPLKDHYDIRLMPFSLHFTFGSKPVLGILAHAYLRDKYEAFDEEHILLCLRKSISEAQLVKGSVYTFQSSKNGIKTLYFEIDKKSGLPFSSEEIHRLTKLLRQEIKFCVEQLVPRIFMTRNEEEVLRSILTLSREIHSPSDIPQVMILFDHQTSQEAIFTVILVRICQRQEPTISHRFASIQGSFTYFPERCQIVRYLQKVPIEANVFRISLPKGTSLLRADLSLNFYLARQKISSLLVDAIGEFRDYNGGIILKQRERLTLFMESFPDISLQNPDLLESFFYSLSPIEIQGTLPLTSFNTLFQLFLEALRFNITKSSDYFYKFIQNTDELFLMVRIPDKTVKETLDKLFSSQPQVVTSVIHLQQTDFLGYLIIAESAQACTVLQEAVA
ncbi:MAG TPA: hypothetical protein VHA52_09400, partial [Candidatus Babeliaceae bacterium]|nr:hypothetical protein [Candidatus Babeliaceae bacterium]